MSLTVRMVGLDARKEISDFEVGNRCGVIQKSYFERVGGMVSESEVWESRPFENVSNC